MLAVRMKFNLLEFWHGAQQMHPISPTASSNPPFSLQPPAVPAPAITEFTRVTWQGDVPSQKWMNFYTKVLSKFATQAGLRIGLHVEIAPQDGVSKQKLDELKIALRELALSDDISTEG